MTVDLGARGLVLPIPGQRPLLAPCVLCGLLVQHVAVGPRSRAKLLFRAREMGGRVYAPRKHATTNTCPDPPPETETFWTDDVRREAWKTARRSEWARALRR